MGSKFQDRGGRSPPRCVVSPSGNGPYSFRYTHAGASKAFAFHVITPRLLWCLSGLLARLMVSNHNWCKPKSAKPFCGLRRWLLKWTDGSIETNAWFDFTYPGLEVSTVLNRTTQYMTDLTQVPVELERQFAVRRKFVLDRNKHNWRSLFPLSAWGRHSTHLNKHLIHQVLQPAH